MPEPYWQKHLQEEQAREDGGLVPVVQQGKPELTVGNMLILMLIGAFIGIFLFLLCGGLG